MLAIFAFPSSILGPTKSTPLSISLCMFETTAGFLYIGSWAAGQITSGIPPPSAIDAIVVTGVSSLPTATFDIVFAVQGAIRTRSAFPFHFPASLTCSVFPVSFLTTGFPVAHSSVSGLTSFSAASDITAFTSAPCLISSLASEGTSMEATLPVTQRMIVLPSSSLPRDDLMSFNGSAESSSFTILGWRRWCVISLRKSTTQKYQGSQRDVGRSLGRIRVAAVQTGIYGKHPSRALRDAQAL